jgi:5-methylcytosine-specific restriction endonuclease McrA
MDTELNDKQRQVLGLEGLRRKRGYREGWLYHLCREKGLLNELQELQLAGLVGDAANTAGNGAHGRADEDEIGEDGGLPMPRSRLTVELVPSTSWFSNLRSELSKDDWDRLRRPVFERAGGRCEVCGGRGAQHPVECHEVWEYDDRQHVQRLVGLVALCPACHEAKHMGYASSMGRGAQARTHLARVNSWSMDDVELYLETQFEQWSRRSQHEWSLDLSWLRQFGMDVSPSRDKKRDEA